MKIIPDYTFANAPAPKVIVIPAQSKPSEAMLKWIRESTKNTDVTMSVCTGAFVLAKTGLLSGKAATTFHGAFVSFAMQFPDIRLKRGARFVEDGNLASAGGLSSGIDLALRVVERYYGREVAQKTAYNMEYQGQGWMNADSNQLYATTPVSTAEHPLCPVCGMEVEVISVSSQRSLVTNCGVRLTAHKTFRQVRGKIDTLLVAGGDSIERDQVNADVVRWLQKIAGRIRRIGSVCTGAMLLARAGLLDGRRATTHWNWCQTLVKRAPRTDVDPDPIFVRDENVYTSAGVTAGMDLALALVEVDYA